MPRSEDYHAILNSFPRTVKKPPYLGRSIGRSLHARREAADVSMNPADNHATSNLAKHKIVGLQVKLITLTSLKPNATIMTTENKPTEALRWVTAEVSGTVRGMGVDRKTFNWTRALIELSPTPKISLDKTFELHFEADMGRSPTNNEQYELVIAIRISKSPDRDKLLKLLGVQVQKDLQSVCWEVKHPNILSRLNNTTILPLNRAPNRDTRIPMGIGLQLYIGEPSVVITFLYPDKQKITQFDFKCPDNCMTTGMPIPKDISELHVHMKNHLESYLYNISKEKEDPNAQYWRFECKKVDPLQEFGLGVERKRPVSPNSEIRGKTKHRKVECRKKSVSTGLNSTASASSETASPTTLEIREKSASTGCTSTSEAEASKPTIRATATEATPEAKATTKKKYRVPKAPPGVTFFRTLTKRPLEEGEYISESDDDTDIEWLRLRTEAIILQDPSILTVDKKFLLRFDRQLEDAHIKGDRHYEAWLPKFTENNKTWLCEEKLVRVLMKKLSELVHDKIIAPKTQKACENIMKLEAERLAAQKLESDRQAAAKLESNRLAQKLESDRRAAHTLEFQRQTAAKLESDRLAAELEFDRLAAQQLESKRQAAANRESEQPPRTNMTRHRSIPLDKQSRSLKKGSACAEDGHTAFSLSSSA